MSCDVGEVTESLENQQSSFSKLCHFTYVSSFSNPSLALPMSQLIIQPFRCFTYVTAHFPTLLSLHLRHRNFTCVTWRPTRGLTSTFSNPSLALPTSQLILQPVFRFSNVIGFSLTSPGELPMPSGMVVRSKQPPRFPMSVHINRFFKELENALRQKGIILNIYYVN